MEQKNKTIYEMLPGLPPYGPAPIAIGNQAPYSEGFVVKFFKENGESWVANFGRGLGANDYVFDYPERKRVWVFAGGQGYLINPEQTEPIKVLKHSYNKILRLDDGRLIAYDPTNIEVIETNGDSWQSERISWDDFKDVIIEGNIVKGLSFDPMDSKNPWVPFSLNLGTKEIDGGSYRRYDFKEISENQNQVIRKK